MITLTGEQLDAVMPYLEAANEEAALATCFRAQCGSVIVSAEGEVIGRGHNSPPLDDETNRICLPGEQEQDWDFTFKPKYDRTCCVHAEQNACLDAAKRNPDKIAGSTLWYMKRGKHGEFTGGGEPFCTACSRIAMQTGVGKFVLWHAADGVAKVWDLPEYNRASYQNLMRRNGEPPVAEATRGGVVL